MRRRRRQSVVRRRRERSPPHSAQPCCCRLFSPSFLSWQHWARSLALRQTNTRVALNDSPIPQGTDCFSRHAAMPISTGRQTDVCSIIDGLREIRGRLTIEMERDYSRSVTRRACASDEPMRDYLRLISRSDMRQTDGRRAESSYAYCRRLQIVSRRRGNERSSFMPCTPLQLVLSSDCVNYRVYGITWFCAIQKKSTAK